MTQESLDYSRIADAIRYIEANFRSQPSPEEVAEKVHLSPFHFQRMFSDWAGVSPKKFLQFITVEYAKSMLKEGNATTYEAADGTGLSGTGRLHDLFVNIEGMTPGEYKNEGELLHINYSFAGTPFGQMLVAATEKGVCYMAFSDDEQTALRELNNLFPRASYSNREDPIQQSALRIFKENWNSQERIRLHLKGTEFQLKVWQSLLKVPLGRFTTYGSLASRLENPKASRAVGSAVGDNPVAYLIPCHRVIRSTGVFGEYHWGSTRKKLLPGWESAKASRVLS